MTLDAAMIDAWFVTINAWMTGSTAIAGLGCFLWGLVSVLFSPCHLASIPLIVGYVAGQGKLMEGREAATYALSFTLGLFLSIAAVGVVCAMLGRMLGDVGPYWTIPVGMVLIWVALDMAGLARCSLTGSWLGKLRVTGFTGAFLLGLAYGVMSGSCTFGFIAPILAIVTIQERFAAGLALIFLFALGHCLPIVVAGSSAALAQRWLETGPMRQGGVWFRRLAAATIGVMGVYFIARPFIGT